MSQIITLIPLIAGEYIQIGTVQLNAMAEEVLEIPLDIIGRLGSAQIGLGASRPPLCFGIVPSVSLTAYSSSKVSASR